MRYCPRKYSFQKPFQKQNRKPFIYFKEIYKKYKKRKYKKKKSVFGVVVWSFGVAVWSFGGLVVWWFGHFGVGGLVAWGRLEVLRVGDS